MAVDLDVSGDWAVIDGTREVTFYSRTGAATFAPAVTLDAAFREPLTREDLLLPALMGVKQGSAWHLWKEHLGTLVPKLNDVIEHDDGTRWLVMRIETVDEGERFRLTCAKEQ